MHCGSVEGGEGGECVIDTEGRKISENIVIDQSDGTDCVFPWTLETYIQVTNKLSTKVPSYEESFVSWYVTCNR